jgi:putative RecB family exonuclease
VATEAFERQWDIEVARESYRTKAHYEDDRRLARESITHFFEDGAGVDHARQSVAAEIRVEFERNGVAYSGYIDNVLRTDEGLELIDYKKSTIAPPVSSRKNYIELQDEGEYRPQRVKNAIQAALYMNGIKETEYYEPGDEVAFTYQPLAEATIDRKGAKISFEFDTEPISVEADIRENSQTVWRIIERAVEEIRNEAFDPAPFGEIKDDQCDRCRFRTMCSEYLTTMEHKL